MCNNVMWNRGLNPSEIPQKGTGWKLFRYEDETIKPGFRFGWYGKSTDGWIQWDDRLATDFAQEQGFCFFLDKEEALGLQENLIEPRVIRKIEYEGGLQERDQDNLCGVGCWRMALCKRFRILEET